MNLSDLKLSRPVKAFLAIGSVLGSLTIALIAALIEDSAAFQELKSAKIPDKLLAIISTVTISVPLLVFALLILSLFVNLILFSRNRLYLKAAEEFAGAMRKFMQKLADETGKDVELSFSGKRSVLVKPNKSQERTE